MKVAELFESKPLLEGTNREVFEALLPIILDEDDGPPVVPNLGMQPTPPNGPIQTPSYGGGWAKGGPFRPYSGGGKWFGELYSSVKQAAVAKRMKDRLKQLGIKGVGVDRVDNAYNTAIGNVRDLIANPQKTAYHFPLYTTKKPKTPKIPVWKEALTKEFALQLQNVSL